MSSASVFNPHVLAELRFIRSSAMSVDHGTKKVAPNFADMSTVRRNIFGPVNHEECRQFVEQSLEKQQEEDMDFWGFDFANEVPVPGQGGRFVWETMPEKPVARPQKRSFEPEYDISHLYAEPLDDVRTASEEEQTDQKVQLDKVKQSLITDFLKSKKNSTNRLKQKKMSITPSPNRIGKITRSRMSIRS